MLKNLPGPSTSPLTSPLSENCEIRLFAKSTLGNSIQKLAVFVGVCLERDYTCTALRLILIPAHQR